MRNAPARTATARGVSRSSSNDDITSSVSSCTDQRPPTQASSTAIADQLTGDGIHVASFWKSPRNREQAIQVALKTYEGHAYLDARIYAMNDAGRMVPTKRGISVGVKTLPQFAKAIGDGLRKAAALGLTAGSS